MTSENGTGPQLDQIGAAIAATEAPAYRMNLIQGQFNESQRNFVLGLPEDVTEAEAYAFIELVTKVRQQAFAAEQAADVAVPRRPRLWRPGG